MKIKGSAKKVVYSLKLLPAVFLYVVLISLFLFPFYRGYTQNTGAFVSPEIYECLETEAYTPVIAVLSARADLEETAALTVETVVTELQRINNISEEQIRTILEQEIAGGNLLDYSPLWIINAFSAQVNIEGLKTLQRMPQIDAIYPDRQYNSLSALEAPSADDPAEAGDSGENEVIQEEMIPLAAPKTEKYPSNIQAINVPPLWEEGYYGEGVVVAIMDTGVDLSHPALEGNYRGNQPGYSHKDSWFDATSAGADSPEPYDDHGHGTYIAGIILGGTKDDPLGIAPEASWIGVNIFSDGYAWDSHITQAFQWLLAPGGNPDAAPDIVNCSWASRPEFVEDYLYWEILYNLEKAGVLVFFAAGNNGEEGPGSPASYPHAFSAGALKQTDGADGSYEAADFSGRGPVHWQDNYYTKPEVVAPGVSIVSTWPGDDFAVHDGTSTATAHLSGAAALLLGARPGLTPAEVKYLLTSTAYWDPLWDQEGKRPNNVYGYGLIDAYAAVKSDSPLPPEIIFSDDGENGVANWRTSPENPWKISREIISQGEFAWAASPWINYENNSVSWLSLLNPLQLYGYHAPVLTFQHFYDLQSGGEENDYAYVEISADGINWSTMFRFSGSNENIQPFSIPLNLPENSCNLYIRFRLLSNNNGPGRGWYIDDLKVSASPLPLSALDNLRLTPEETSLNVGMKTNVLPEAVFGSEVFRTIQPETVAWSSSNPAVALIEDGVVTGLSVGESIIRGVFSNHIAEFQIRISN